MNEISNADKEAVVALLNRSELESIDFHEISVRRYDGVAIDETEQQGGVDFSFQRRADGETFGVRSRAELKLPVGEAVVTVAATYRILDGDAPSERDVELFANEVAVMAMFPYVREGLSTATAKVFGAPITLPVAQRGQLGFEVE